MEWAFRGPATLKDRLGDRFDAASIAAMDPEDLVAVFCAKPALHRYPAAMARRAHELCVFLVDRYGGDAGAVWRNVRTGDELYRRLRELPGYGEEKSKIFMAILAKRMGKRPTGWEEAAAPFSDAIPRSVADIDSPEALVEGARVQEGEEGSGQGQGRLTPTAPGAAAATEPAQASRATAELAAWLRWRSSQPSSTATDRGSWRS